MSQEPSAPRSIRQAHADRTRLAILASARHLFARHGYAEAGVRDIAAHAGVNPALVGRYFGSKLELFEAALEASFDVTHFTRAGRETFGKALAADFCLALPEAAGAVPMLILAAGDTAARDVALKVLTRQVVEPLRQWFGEPEPAERAAQLIAVVTGFYTYRLMLPLATIADVPTPAMQRWLADTLQEIVDRR
ncbi:MAG: TetR family transcriptional regulator [Novosphingobium sp.]